MKLSAYLSLNEISDADFAAAIGVERQAVHRYRSGQRTPTKAILGKIFKRTAGQVTANDFFDLAYSIAPTSEPERAA
jgi:transcriptional regulator with XRE-family HTH domain